MRRRHGGRHLFPAQRTFKHDGRVNMGSGETLAASNGRAKYSIPAKKQTPPIERAMATVQDRGGIRAGSA